MPFFGDAPVTDLAARADVSTTTPTTDQRSFAATYTAGQDRGALGTGLALGVGSVVDLIDTVGSSVIPGVHRQDLNNTFLNAIGSPGLTKWYDENRGAVEVGSTVAGIIAADMAAKRVLAPAGYAMKALRAVPWVKNVATLDAQYERAISVARLTSTEVAKRGATGVERFIGPDLSFAALGRPAVTIAPKDAARGVMWAQTKRGLAQNVTMEGIMGATMHTNNFLYSDDFAHNIAWGVAGLGIGAGVDSLISTYTLRKIANSDAIRRINAGAYDPTGKEADRLNAYGLADVIAKGADGAVADQRWRWTGAGATTDRITSMMVGAKELRQQRGFTERAMSLFRKREAISTPVERTAFDELNKVTVRGLRGLSRAGFSTASEGLGAPLKESLDREPAFLYGIEEVGTEVDELGRVGTVEARDAAVKKRYGQVQDLLANGGKWQTRKLKGGEFVDELIPLADDEHEALLHEANELAFTSTHVPVTMVEPGEWAPMSVGKIADEFEPRQIIREGSVGQDDVAIWQRKKDSPSEATLGIRSDGEMYLPANANLNRLDLNDMLHLYHAGAAMVKHFAENGVKFVVPSNPTWFHLDLAEQLLKATKNPSMVEFPAKMTRESAQVESFAQKVDALRSRESTLGMAKLDIDDSQVYRNKIYFNLPRLTSYQQGLLGTMDHPLDILVNAFKDGEQVRNTPYSEILKGFDDGKKIMGLTDDTAPSLGDLHGNSFNFLRDRDGKIIEPIVGYKRAMNPAEWSQDDLLIRQTAAAMELRRQLLGETADPVTKEIVNMLTSDPNFVEAGKVAGLADDQHRSFVPGFRHAAPETTPGSLINSLTSRERRDADNLTMLAASKIKENQTRITQQLMREIIESSMGDLITTVNSTRNVASKLQLNQFHSFRQGWELVRNPVKTQLPKGDGYTFILDHTSVANQERFEQAFGRQLTEGQALLNPNGQAIVLDQLAFDTVNAMQKVHDTTLQMKNTLLRAKGLRELKSVPFYAPAPNTKGKYLGYTFDAQDNVIPGMTMIADSPDELKRMESDLMKSKQWQNGYTFRQRQEAKSFMDLWDKAQMDWVAPNSTPVQSNKHNFGKTSGNQLNTSAFDEALITMRDSLVNHGDDIMDVLFEQPIKSARARAEISKVQSAVGSRSSQEHSSIFDRYIQNLTGQSSLSAKDSFFGDFMQAAESRMNGLLASDAAMSVGDVYQGLKDYLALARPARTKASTERFNRISQELGPYMPFKSVNEMLERETGSRTPKEVADITSKLSWFEAASRLRWLESFHAVANIGGILSNMSSVIRAIQPYAGETIEEAARRNSSLAMMMALPSGKAIALPNVNKLLWHSMKDAWKKVPDDFTQRAIRLGYMDQEVAEFNRQWGSIDSKAGWRKFVFGDAAQEVTGADKTLRNAGQRFIKSGGLDKWLSILSDRSEAFSRQWGMYAGKRVAESIGIHGVDDQIAFAHDITNRLIANYDPRNRPELFQGALGAPIGLFQSYVFNFYQRMFRYVETKNGRALASQMAAQSAVFGIHSLPGWGAVNWAFMDHGQAEGQDPVDTMYHRLGNTMGDLVMHGTLSNLPRLFGADGVSLYTRGDVQVRLPVVNLPVADTVSRMFGGIKQGIDTFRAENGHIGMNHLAEIASNMITNRPLSGMIEVAGAHGYDTSFDGQVVSETRGTMDSIYRVLGVKAMQQQKEVEAFYANKNAQEEQNSRKGILRSATRAAIRNGTYKDVPGLFAKYVDEGGDPRYYSRWIKESFKSALDTRGERELEDALKDKDGSKNAYIARLLDSQVSVDDDEQATDDYGRQKQIDSVISQGWEATPNSTTVDDPTDPTTATPPL